MQVTGDGLERGNEPGQQVTALAAGERAASQSSPPPPPREVANYARILALAAALFLAWHFLEAIAEVLLLLFAAFLVAVVLNAPVRRLERRGVRRSLSTAGVALILLGGIVTAGALVGPPLANEATSLVQNGPREMRRIRQRVEKFTEQYPALRGVLKSEAFNEQNAVKEMRRALPKVGRYTKSLIGAVAAFIILVVTSLYMLGSPRPLIGGVLSAVPPGYRRSAARALTRIVGQLESWAVATLILMAIVGVVCGLGLWLLKVPNAVLFGVLAGIGEGIPTIGPILSSIPPILVALADEPRKALWVALLFLGVQQVENHVLVPLVMGRSLKLHPVSILFFVLALSVILGAVGALLAVPAAIITKVLWEEFYLRSRRPRPAALRHVVEQVMCVGSRPKRRDPAAPR